MKRVILPLIVIVLVVAATVDAQKFEGLAETPPMGWNSWNAMGIEIDEDLAVTRGGHRHPAVVPSGGCDPGGALRISTEPEFLRQLIDLFVVYDCKKFIGR